MSKIFDAYAAYYDIFYGEKDYAGEASYVSELIRRYRSSARDVLELGCGTGAHAFELASLGYQVTGIDISDAMVQRARQKAESFAPKPAPRFAQGDLRDFRTESRFDVVLALFHVMSYQTTNEALAAAMETASIHLRPGGILIFDCWYGPAVLCDQPSVRVKRVTGTDTEITRIAEPVLHPNENRVDVHYDIMVSGAGRLDRIRETHSMRYLFAPEVDLFLNAANLTRLHLESWMEGGDAGTNSWNACFIASR